MDISPEIAAKYIRWVEKKAAGKPAPMVTMMKRTNATAMAVLSELEDVSFTDLSSSLYFICQDLKAEEFVHRYEAQLELAGANQDAFVKGLHKFFNDTARFIKENDLYEEYFEFITLCNRLRCEDAWNEKSSARRKVMAAYQSLLMQNLEYMRPNKFDFSTVVCGIDTQGNIMVTKDMYPNIDECIRELESILEKRSRPASTSPLVMEAIIYEVFKNRYPNIRCLDDLNNAMEDDRVFTHHHAALGTYLNEYNFDILPSADKIFSRSVLPYLAMQTERIDVAALEQSLNKRARALPPNGVLFEFKIDGQPIPSFFESVLMREVYHNDRIVMLYKYTLNGGEAAGFYDTKDQFLYSILQEASDPEPYQHLRAFILYLYAATTTRGGEKMLEEIGDKIYLAETQNGEENPRLHITVEAFARGGKLYRTYGSNKAGEHKLTGPRAGNEKYEATDRNIQGFVRKVGAGRSPSREAVERAEALGYQLAPDETYVQPFVRKVLRLRKKF